MIKKASADPVTGIKNKITKEELEKAGIFIDTIRGPYGGYILNQKVYIPPKDDTQEKLKMSELDKKIYNTVTKALKEEKKVLLTYLSSDEIVRERVIHPMDLRVYNHNWYIPAYCEYRKSMRHFQFSRVKDIKLLD